MPLKMLLILTVFALSIDLAIAEEKTTPEVDVNGTIHVPAFTLPESSFLSEESKAALKRQREIGAAEYKTMDCPSFKDADMKDMPAIRQCRADHFYTRSLYKDMHQRYAVKQSTEVINGVYTEIFTPAAGIKKNNTNKVLINLHGGGFQYGSRTFSHLESIPIAVVGRIKVVSIDYRMAPEHKFPAANEDIENVYRGLLEHYKPENIGMYGCSAGAILTAQSMAWLQKENLPLPGAIGMFCGAASRLDGDGMHIGSALKGRDMFAYVAQDVISGPKAYFRGVDMSDPLATPAGSDDILSRFPASLLIVSTRDFLLSSVIHTHRQLVRLGVDADLQIWEGVGHDFHADPSLPEAREAYDVIVKFFDKHLGGL